ncbi:thiazole synthase [Arachidicoccus terrestris]|nr:thiazole synthase [Arachidicoccus terrestris]UAY57253.1 thiazole synthase [Arachidicoccus terrestris]
MGVVEDALVIAGETFSSRLLLGTGKYGDLAVMRTAIETSGTEMVTLALRRLQSRQSGTAGLSEGGSLLDYIPKQPGKNAPHSQPMRLLPNTSGARNAAEAVLAAQLARELLHTNFIKLEIHPDPSHLMPDPVETLQAAAVLVQKGFIVLPYVHADPVLCKRLEQAGVAAVMPLGSPIGSNLGLKSRDFLEIIIAEATIPVIIDAGIGSPSDAALAMEMGADAVLISTAVATAADPVTMATAFKLAVEAGRLAYRAGLAGRGRLGEASSPLTDFLS